MNKLTALSNFIDNQASSMVDLQSMLTSIPALDPGSGGKGELAKCRALEKWLTEKGFTSLERFDCPDPRSEGGVRPNLVVTVKGTNSDRSIWIMSHLDVVPAGELSLWKTDPWTVVEKDGRIFGRGVEDNQQGMVSSIFAALSFIELGIKPVNDVKLLFVSDEETGSDYGIQYLLNEHSLFGRDDLIIIPDGGDSKGETIEIAEKNLLWMKIKTAGKQTHGSRPDEGNNAFLAACDFALRLHGMIDVFSARDELFEPPVSTFEPTKKEANVPNVNTIPGDDVFYMDCRILPCYSLNEVRKEVKKRAGDVESKYGVSISISEEQAVESPATQKDAPVVTELTRAIEFVYGNKVRPIGIGGGTVGAYLRKAGLNAAVWSRLDETAHQPNEYCVISHMTGDAKVLASVMCGSIC